MDGEKRVIGGGAVKVFARPEHFQAHDHANQYADTEESENGPEIEDADAFVVG